jgi:hypothetical protein
LLFLSISTQYAEYRYCALPLTPVKKQAGQEHLDAAYAWLSRAVSQVRQPVESIFNWNEENGHRDRQQGALIPGASCPCLWTVGLCNVSVECPTTKRLIWILAS